MVPNKSGTNKFQTNILEQAYTKYTFHVNHKQQHLRPRAADQWRHGLLRKRILCHIVVSFLQ